MLIVKMDTTRRVEYVLNAAALELLHVISQTVMESTGTSILLFSIIVPLTLAFDSKPGYSASASPCSQCAAGSSAKGGLVSDVSTACILCVAGTHASLAGSSSCTTCATQGYTGSTPGAVDCTVCTGPPTIHFDTCDPITGYDLTCPAGYGLGATTTTNLVNSCGPCKAGSYSPDMATSCTPCSNTQYSTAGAGSCTDCFTGTDASRFNNQCDSVTAVATMWLVSTTHLSHTMTDFFLFCFPL